MVNLPFGTQLMRLVVTSVAVAGTVACGMNASQRTTASVATRPVAALALPPPSESPPDLWVPIGLPPIEATACIEYAWSETASPIEVELDSEPQGAVVVSAGGRRLGITPVRVSVPVERNYQLRLYRRGSCSVVSEQAPPIPGAEPVGFTSGSADQGWDPGTADLVARDTGSGEVLARDPAGVLRYNYARPVRGWIFPDARTVREVQLSFDCSWLPLSGSLPTAAASACNVVVHRSEPPPVQRDQALFDDRVEPLTASVMLTGFRPELVSVAATEATVFVRMVSNEEYEMLVRNEINQRALEEGLDIQRAQIRATEQLAQEERQRREAEEQARREETARLERLAQQAAVQGRRQCEALCESQRSQGQNGCASRWGGSVSHLANLISNPGSASAWIGVGDRASCDGSVQEAYNACMAACR